MKVPVILTAAFALLVSTAWNSAAATPRVHTRLAPVRLAALHPFQSLGLADLGTAARDQTLQAAPTATATATGQPTAAPTATSTPNNFPDPTTLVQKMLLVYSAVQSLHFVQSQVEEQLSIEKVTLTATGDATCKNQAVKTHLVGKDELEGTSQVKKLNAYYVIIKKKAWEWSPQETKKVWKAVKYTKPQDLGLTIDNFLNCASSSSSGSSSGSSGGSAQLKDLVNLGPDTFQGIPVWHIRGTEVLTDTNGTTTEAQVDFLIGRDHFLPYVYTVTGQDTQNNITFTLKQTLTKFGEKLTIKAPKVGSTKP